ncbi:1-deoxy-D-xylulose-5-phosphate reductoisomerase [Parachitinimonas caeni]|uniref:1-deoxy-D-xylulose 5-phosphate reductoisomerase n=1 Tax=Parachitinimonas caeni TaxID=3031301 RepID=A0ABT7DX29_9NEIS|nr:1-deoxy-D-xylulose-5-phosphate reductoisomerase [Parachitinimonas caeni]MDK2124621.1 1-deoxy-D-xylulose-5-phosphate reductoisomerase [Parachitinimonas caeni]
MSKSSHALTILGSTGSIGLSTLDVVARHPDRYKVVALTANQQIERLFEQCLQFRPAYVAVLKADLAAQLRSRVRDAGLQIEVLEGESGLQQVATLPEVDTVMAAIVGAAGLVPTLAAAKAGKRILLANKETLVLSGQLFMDAVKQANACLLPIDSEHNAIFQSLPHPYPGNPAAAGVRKIILTASGGPFREWESSSLEQVTPAQAIKHPNWSMGRKISVDSATLMNKGLEVIEARWLFDALPDQIDVVIHPQSIIHSMVEYLDGSTLAQLGNPDMRTPIAYALAYPERIVSGVEGLNLAAVGRLDFMEPDLERFPCLRLAFDALRMGGAASAVLNAANEVAVDAFLDERLRFDQIAVLNERVMLRLADSYAGNLEDLLAIDQESRNLAHELLSRVTGKIIV